MSGLPLSYSFYAENEVKNACLGIVVRLRLENNSERAFVKQTSPLKDTVMSIVTNASLMVAFARRHLDLGPAWSHVF